MIDAGTLGKMKNPATRNHRVGCQR